jgi:outer membrane protein OmpA-like peptidoglycan-associated protein
MKRVALACGLALLAGGGVALAQDQPTEAQILDALKARGPARAGHDSPVESRQADEDKRFIEALRKKNPRTITVEERRRVADIVDQKPRIDLEITFGYDSSVVGPEAVPALVSLGRALADKELEGATFLIAGHTDANGGDAYNQALSELRAEAVKGFLVEQFKLPPDHLLAVGYGRERLKNSADPFGPENRRVQVVNMEAN